MKKTYTFTVIELAYAFVILVVSYLMFVLMMKENISSSSGAQELAAAIAIIFGVIFYFVYVVLHWILGLYTVVELFYVRFSLKRNKRINVVFIIGMVMRILFVLLLVVTIVCVFVFGFTVGGIFASVLFVLRAPLMILELIHLKRLKNGNATIL